jgi:glyoxylase-like metal-dependent hydrolase (beta-lactamase superfamily II)
LLIETAAGLVLVDTGLGEGDLQRGGARLGLGFRLMVRPRLLAAETAKAQVERLGFSARDVRHIIVTHLDGDHAGGLAEFPEASVHVHASEHAAATAPSSYIERHRYIRGQWAHAPRWHLYGEAGERWNGFDAVRNLGGLGEDILLVPLFGHTRGHCGVAVKTDAGWLLHAGDAFFHHHEIAGRRAPLLLERFQHLMAIDRAARLHNRRRLRALAGESAVRIVCAHDPAQLEAA